VVGYGDPAYYTGAYGIVLAHHPVRSSAHDAKHGGDHPASGVVPQTPPPTFSDALALVRKDLWANATFYGSPAQSDTVKLPRAYLERLTDAVCCAA